ncbi:Retrovirus-related Pol polyprotein from transposon RE1 [Vitis vinifera]|uniref:Retrovirus-related Pol polyprotein from transposon RE1 n=1 Tax=Vitis vinifera TaxID=29760 RepID=A0A438INM0_VITVI|nr:Retrovirus-related Pol polyprotein from transposon RE1 [Vitis vinifera]
MADSSFSFNTMIHMVTIKLSSTNYLLWQNQLLPFLQCQNLLSHVDGSVAPPPITIAVDSSSSQPNPQYVAWQLQDQRLLSLLFSSLTEEAMVEVLGLTTARDVWLALENSFSHISKTRELRIKDDLQLIKRGTRSVTEYSRSFKALCDQLTAMGRSVDDTEKVHWYLRGLGADFANFSTAQMSLTPLMIFKDLVPKAKSFEIFQKSLGSSFPVSSAAFTATNGSFPSSRGGSSSKSRRSRSGYHGGHGHGRGKRGSYIPRCQIYKTEGHTTDRCRSRYDRAEPTAQLTEAFTTTCSLSNGSESDWFTDTGASPHMTPDPSQLDKVEPYHGKDCVIVGNGASLPITHTSTLSSFSNFQLLDVLVVPRLIKNLLSISKLTSDFPLSVTFSHDNFVVQNQITGMAVAKEIRIYMRPLNYGMLVLVM